MKALPDRPFALPALRAALEKGGLLEGGARLKLEPLQPDFLRRGRYRRWHYRVSSREKVLCHLIAGLDLAPLQARAEQFHAACPGLVCRPLLFQEQRDGMGFLCLEYFPGESLDAAVQNGRCTAEQWLAAIRQVQHLLEQTSQPSDQTGLHREIQSLLDDTSALPGFSRVDALLLRELAQATIFEGASAGPLSTRWSNGDFAGRNLLINAGGAIRLIDYESAAPTHFGDSDWLRLMKFSVIPSGLDEAQIPEVKALRQPWREVHSWLQHLSHLRQAEPSARLKSHVAFAVSRFFIAIGRAARVRPAGSKSSRLIDILSAQQEETEALLQERTAWARSLETELQKTRAAFAEQEKVVGEHSALGRSLEAELRSTKDSFTKLAKEHAERTKWAKSLEAELHSTKDSFAKLAKSLEAELRSTKDSFAKLAKEHAARTQWAGSLEAELSSTKDSFAKLVGEFEERTKLARSLEAELLSTKDSFAKVTNELAERTAWTRSLEAELQSTKDSFTKLAGEFEERTTWALSLRTDLDKLTAQNTSLLAFRGKSKVEIENLRSTCTILTNKLEESRTQALQSNRNLLAKEAALHAEKGALFSARLNQEAQTAEITRLGTALGDAQQHLENILSQDRARQSMIANLNQQLDLLRSTLSKYENSLICRLATRRGRSSKQKLSQ